MVPHIRNHVFVFSLGISTRQIGISCHLGFQLRKMMSASKTFKRNKQQGVNLILCHQLGSLETEKLRDEGASPFCFHGQYS